MNRKPMQVTPELLEKYHLKLCSKQEQELVEEWLLSDESDNNYPSVSGENDAIEEIWQQLNEQVRPAVVSPVFKSARILKMLTGIAACVAITFGIWVLSPSKELPSQSFKSELVAVKSVSTKAAERRKYTLPDGTVVYLNAGSELRYEEHFTDTSRVAWLTGEAYFEVTKDPSRPFTIHTAHSETRVLGTAFSLKAYPGDVNTTLIVQEGKVRFSDSRNKGTYLTLTANEKGVIQDNRQPTKSNVYAAGYTAWKENRLVFNNQKLTEIVPVLERWYGIKIEIGASELGARRCTGTFVNPTLKSLMASMGYSMNFKYTIQNNELLIY